jgi:formate hydrogenlyase transcriptional activator
LLHPDDLQRLREARRPMTRGHSVELEGRLLGRDGGYRWFLMRINPQCDANDRVVRWCGTRTDIDDLKRSEERVRQDERQIRMLVDFVPQQLLMLAPNGRILYANRAALEYTGLTLEETIARPDVWLEIVHQSDQPNIRGMLRSLANGIGADTTIRLRRHDGRYRWILTRNAPLYDDAGRVLRWFTTGTDIDDLKLGEERVRAENRALREEVDKASMFEEIVGSSPALRTVLTSISQVAATGSTVLITGETGTGKELIARAIHKRSPRAGRAFVSVNCAALAPSLIFSELFGHEKGAFTGAARRQPGRFELAHGGTIFLDEVGDLPLETQIALLRILQERVFERVGGSEAIKVDVRVIAATNRDLAAAQADGRFRSDLFYRLDVFPIEVPPLRERKEDVRVLTEYFVHRFARQAGKSFQTIDSRTLELFQAYEWPGNIRELQNVVERSVIVSSDETFRVDEAWLLKASSPTRREAAPPSANLDFGDERQIIEAALAASRGRVSGPTGAASRLGVPPSTLEYRIKKLMIRKDRFRLG